MRPYPQDGNAAAAPHSFIGFSIIEEAFREFALRYGTAIYRPIKIRIFQNNDKLYLTDKQAPNYHQTQLLPAIIGFGANRVGIWRGEGLGGTTQGNPYKSTVSTTHGGTAEGIRRYSSNARWFQWLPKAKRRGETSGGSPETFRGFGRLESMPHE